MSGTLSVLAFIKRVMNGDTVPMTVFFECVTIITELFGVRYKRPLWNDENTRKYQQHIINVFEPFLYEIIKNSARIIGNVNKDEFDKRLKLATDLFVRRLRIHPEKIREIIMEHLTESITSLENVRKRVRVLANDSDSILSLLPHEIIEHIVGYLEIDCKELTNKILIKIVQHKNYQS